MKKTMAVIVAVSFLAFVVIFNIHGNTSPLKEASGKLSDAQMMTIQGASTWGCIQAALTAGLSLSALLAGQIVIGSLGLSQAITSALDDCF